MRRPNALVPLVALVALALGACDDALDQRLAIIDAPRVLAVIAEPAEARPGATVVYRAVIASPGGPIDVPTDVPTDAPTDVPIDVPIDVPVDAPIDVPIDALAERDGVPRWAYCTTPKAPTEDNVVSAACVAGEALVPLVSDVMSATGVLPMDACMRFGPDVPPGGFRPRDADLTGGFYQPVRLDTGELAPLAFGMSRITCNLANATPEAFRQYVLEYVANENPTIDAVRIANDLAPMIAADTDVTIDVSWPAETIESYLYYDRARQRLVTRRESLRVSFFATGGAFPVDSIAIDEPALGESVATSASITWRTPPAGVAHLWIVLRDARGGVDVRTIAVTIDER